MKAELRIIDNSNYEECISLTVAQDQAEYISSNESSLKEAEENADIARPFAIYTDDKMVGFTMLAFDEEYEDPHSRYRLWRFMTDKNLQGKGYGRAALEEIIRYFKSNSAKNIMLSSNTGAISLYHKFGFKENGEMNGEETVFELIL